MLADRGLPKGKATKCGRDYGRDPVRRRRVWFVRIERVDRRTAILQLMDAVRHVVVVLLSAGLHQKAGKEVFFDESSWTIPLFALWLRPSEG